MHIKFLENEIAKNFIKDYKQSKELLKYLYVIEWLKEENFKLYLLYLNDI